MQTAFRVVYSLVVAILFVLFVILGTLTFYDGPEEPQYPSVAYPVARGLDKPCPAEEACPEVAESDEEYRRQVEEYERAQDEYQREWEVYLDDRADYHRNVFIVASLLGIVAIAAGVVLFQRVEALPLGLLLGGLGVVIFGWSQAAEDFDEIGAAPIFIVVAVGLAIVLAAGYRFLGAGRPAADG